MQKEKLNKNIILYEEDIIMKNIFKKIELIDIAMVLYVLFTLYLLKNELVLYQMPINFLLIVVYIKVRFF